MFFGPPRGPRRIRNRDDVTDFEVAPERLDSLFPRRVLQTFVGV
jgi:hypothetical protein